MAVKSFIKLAQGYLLARGWYLRGLQQRPMDPEHHDQVQGGYLQVVALLPLRGLRGCQGQML
jgi:hypothetical protein